MVKLFTYYYITHKIYNYFLISIHTIIAYTLWFILHGGSPIEITVSANKPKLKCGTYFVTASKLKSSPVLPSVLVTLTINEKHQSLFSMHSLC